MMVAEVYASGVTCTGYQMIDVDDVGLRSPSEIAAGAFHGYYDINIDNFQTQQQRP